MGYAIVAAVKSKRARETMSAFLAEHYRSWYTLAQEHGYQTWYESEHADPTAVVSVEGEMCYDDGKVRIGFSYSRGLEHEYMHTFLRWVALKVGRKRVIPRLKDVGITHAIPYLVYDGYQAWPVLLDPEGALQTTDFYWCACTPFGTPLYPREFHRRVEAQKPSPTGLQQYREEEQRKETERYRIAELETQRLDNLWVAQSPLL